jgi:hypothetical protein
MSQVERREARLKPEFAQLYPPIEASHWELAGVIADRVLAWRLNTHSGYVSVDRVLQKEHFEFRGISVHLSDAPGNRTRVGDGTPLSSSVPSSARSASA